MENNSQRLGPTLFVLCGAAFMAGLDLFVVNVALHDIGDAFPGNGFGDIGWVINAYAIVFAALLIPAGRWADRVGRKRGFLIGVGVFTAASLGCALAPSLWVLVLARCVQAVGAAVMTPASLGLIVVSTTQENRAGAIRMWATSSALAAAAGPVVGGLLVQISWEWVFVINVPIGIGLIAVGAVVLRDAAGEAESSPDVWGAVLIAMAIGGLSLGLVQGPTWGWTSLGVAGSLAVCVVGACGLVWHTRRAANPIVPRDLLKIPSFSGATVSMVLFSVPFAGVLLVSTLFMQSEWQYDALRTGLAIAPGPLIVPIFVSFGGRFAARVGPRIVAVIGCAFVALGTGIVAVSLGEAPGYLTEFLPGWMLVGVGVGFAMPTIMALGSSSLPRQLSSTGGAVLSVGRQVGSVLGVSAVIAILDSTADGRASHTATSTVLWVMAGLAAAAAAGTVRASRRRVNVSAPSRARTEDLRIKSP